MRSYWWPITSAGVRISRRSSRGGAMRPKNRPWQHGGARLRVLADPVEQDVGLPRQPPARDQARRAGQRRARPGSPAVSATISGVNASAQPISAWSSTGISITIPRRRSGARAAASSATLAPSEVPDHDRLGLVEVVEQRDDLAPKAGIE